MRADGNDANRQAEANEAIRRRRSSVIPQMRKKWEALLRHWQILIS